MERGRDDDEYAVQQHGRSEQSRRPWNDGHGSTERDGEDVDGGAIPPGKLQLHSREDRQPRQQWKWALQWLRRLLPLIISNTCSIAKCL
mgnify:CR=1 FL=1